MVWKEDGGGLVAMSHANQKFVIAAGLIVVQQDTTAPTSAPPEPIDDPLGSVYRRPDYADVTGAP